MDFVVFLWCSSSAAFWAIARFCCWGSHGLPLMGGQDDDKTTRRQDDDKKTSVFPLYFHRISTVFPPYVHCISFVFPPYSHCMSTACPPYFYRIFVWFLTLLYGFLNMFVWFSIIVRMIFQIFSSVVWTWSYGYLFILMVSIYFRMVVFILLMIFITFSYGLHYMLSLFYFDCPMVLHYI